MAARLRAGGRLASKAKQRDRQFGQRLEMAIMWEADGLELCGPPAEAAEKRRRALEERAI